MDDREMAQVLGLGRIVIGTAMFLMPKHSIRMWTGEDSGSHTATMAVRGLGARDVAIGAGILISIEEGKNSREWLQASALADSADALGTVAMFKRLPKGRALLALAVEVGAAVVGLRLADALD